LLSLLIRCSLTVVFSIEVLCPFPCLLSLVHEPSSQFENTGADCPWESEETIERVRSVIVEIWWCFVLSRCPNSDLAKPKSWFLGVFFVAAVRTGLGLGGGFCRGGEDGESRGGMELLVCFGFVSGDGFG
jgi:hypothetical protein